MVETQEKLDEAIKTLTIISKWEAPGFQMNSAVSTIKEVAQQTLERIKGGGENG